MATPVPTPAASGDDGLDRLQARLLAWRREGAWRADPASFHFLEALARRLLAAPAALRPRLLPRLQAGVDGYGRRLAQAQQAVAGQAQALAARLPALARPLRALQASGDERGLRLLAARHELPPDCAPLAALNRHIQGRSPALQGSGAEAGPDELASLRRFRRAWSQGRSRDQLARAASRRPVNAGPLNSHALVLQALEQMQSLSPDYLRHFLAQVEALQWLESARDAPLEGARAARAGKAGKPAGTTRARSRRA